MKPTMRIKLKRIEQGMKIKDMADLLGITESAYRHKENGIRGFKVTELSAICNHLGIAYEEIFLPENTTKRKHKK